MNRVVILCLLLTCSAALAGGDQVPKLWFPVGERAVYRLYWGVIRVGEAEFWSEWRDTADGRRIALLARAKTTSIVEHIYPVDDLIEAVVDPETFLPILYTQKLNEGRHSRYDKMVFDHKECRAEWSSGIKDEKRAIDIDADTRDPLTLVYWLRAKGFVPGQKQQFRVLTDDKVYDLTVAGKRREKVKIPDHGQVDCVVVEPTAKFGEIFVRSGKVHMWFSDDERRMCTRMTGRLPVASVKAVLLRVEGPDAEGWPGEEGAEE